MTIVTYRPKLRKRPVKASPAAIAVPLIVSGKSGKRDRLSKELPDDPEAKARVAAFFARMGAAGQRVRGMVQFIDYDSPAMAIPEGNLFNPFLRERKSYEHEREVWAVLLRHESEPQYDADDPRGALGDVGVKVPIDLNSVVQNIFVSPTSLGWFRTVAEGVALRYGVRPGEAIRSVGRIVV